MNVLLVDDKKENRYLLETLLTGKGYRTFSANNGKEAVKILEKETVDLIISDILMPEMDGYQLCRIVQAHAEWKHIPFIFYTATFTTRQDEILALKIGAARFLRKPMEPEPFIEQIREVLEKFHAGEIKAGQPKYKDEQEVLRLYDERMVQKLEDKMRALENERALFSEVFDRAPILMTLYDPDIRILRLNEEFKKVTGWTEEDIKKINIMEACYPDPEYREKVRAFMIPARKGWQEFRLTCKDGHVIDSLWSNIRMPDDTQVGIGIDITRQKKNEQELQKHLEESKFLAEMSIALSHIQNIGEICQLIGEKVYEIQSDSHIVMTVYDDERKGICITCMEGLDKYMDQIVDIMGRNPLDVVIPPDQIRPERLSDYKSGKLIQIPDGIYELFGHRFPRNRCRQIEKLLNISAVWHIGFTINDMPYGTLTILLKQDHPVRFRFAIETLIGTAAAIYKRLIAEEALRQSEKRFRSLFDNTTIGFYQTSPEGKILIANPALIRMLGFESLEELQQRNLEKNGYEPDYPREKFKKALAETGEVVGLEAVWKRKDQGKLFVRENAHVVHNENGDIEFYEGTVEDISYQKKAEAELKLRAQLLDMASDSIFLHDMEGNFIYFNENAHRTLGYTREEFNGFKLQEIDALQYAEKIPDRMQSLLERGYLSFETEHRHKDGTPIPMEISARVIEMDKKPHILAAARNISERKKTESALKDSETRFRMIAENIRDGITYIEKGEVQYRNNRVCDILGYTKAELQRFRIHELAAPENADRVNAEFSAKMKSNLNAFDIDFWVVRKNGERRYINNRYSIPDPAHPDTYYVTTTDQTEWKNAEEERIRLQDQLLQSQKLEAIGTLAGGVAHDFNNLLTVIQGHAQLLMLSMDQGDSYYRDLKQIEYAAIRAANLTRQLLLFSRKQSMFMKTIDVNQTISNLLKMLKRLIGEDIEIQTIFTPDIWFVEADEGNLEQVIMNLSVNARDAMPKGGQLTIKTENVQIGDEDIKIIPESKAGRYVRISIEDSGIGIPEEILPNIFDPFFTTKEVGKGTGLGLSVVYGILKKHNGWINVYSEPGSGTIFKIYLPVTTRNINNEKKVKMDVENLPGNGERILLIEDENGVRSFISAALRQNGYIVFEVKNAASSMEIFQNEKGAFDLIISDIILPDKNGYQLIRELLHIHPDIPVIMSSGYTDEKIQQSDSQGLEYRFIQKPYNFQDLLVLIKDVLGARG